MTEDPKDRPIARDQSEPNATEPEPAPELAEVETTSDELAATEATADAVETQQRAAVCPPAK